MVARRLRSAALPYHHLLSRHSAGLWAGYVQLAVNPPVITTNPRDGQELSAVLSVKLYPLGANPGTRDFASSERFPRGLSIKTAVKGVLSGTADLVSGSPSPSFLAQLLRRQRRGATKQFQDRDWGFVTLIITKRRSPLRSGTKTYIASSFPTIGGSAQSTWMSQRRATSRHSIASTESFPAAPTTNGQPIHLSVQVTEFVHTSPASVDKSRCPWTSFRPSHHLKPH